LKIEDYYSDVEEAKNQMARIEAVARNPIKNARPFLFFVKITAIPPTIKGSAISPNEKVINACPNCSSPNAARATLPKKRSGRR